MILSIDPGSSKGNATCGVALIDEAAVARAWPVGSPCGDLIETWAIDGTDVAAAARLVMRARELGAPILIERQFPNIRTSANPVDLEKVIECRVTIRTIATISQVRVEEIYPAQWQTILKAAPDLPELRKASPSKPDKSIRDTKKCAAWLCRHLWPDRKLGKHEADAALMGRWWAERHPP